MSAVLGLLLALNVARAAGHDETSSEAERCARALAESHEETVGQRLSALDRSAAHVDEALARMRSAGDFASDGQAERIEAKLRFGAAFRKEGLVHEAIHQTFIARYRTPAGVAAALRNFRHLGDPAEKGRLIAEVIERVLQFVPDVDVENVVSLEIRAAFLNMTAADLIDVRDRWQAHDARDEFSSMLQTALLAWLEDASELLVDDVLARDAWARKFAREARAIRVPARPEPLDETITPALVALEHRRYFDANDLAEYLDKSSVAARRFFIGHWLPYLAVDELARIFERRETLDLKPSLGRAVLAEVQRRRAAAGRIARRDDLRRELNGVERALREVTEKQRDTRLRHDEIGRLWGVSDPSDAYRAGDRLIERVVTEGTPAEFVNIVVSVRDAILSRMRGRADLTTAFVKATVERANQVGLDEGQRQKVERVLSDVVQFLSARQAKAPRTDIARLQSARGSVRSVDRAGLRRRLTELALSLKTLELELAREWS